MHELIADVPTLHDVWLAVKHYYQYVPRSCCWTCSDIGFVERRRIELPTFALRTRRSPSCAPAPILDLLSAILPDRAHILTSELLDRYPISGDYAEVF